MPGPSLERYPWGTIPLHCGLKGLFHLYSLKRSAGKTFPWVATCIILITLHEIQITASHRTDK